MVVLWNVIDGKMLVVLMVLWNVIDGKTWVVLVVLGSVGGTVKCYRR